MTWLAACAAPMSGAVPASASAGMRVLVKLAQASADTSAIAAQVTAAAGTNARYLSATSPQWHALVLQCADAQACEAAFQRLSADRTGFEAVQRDERRRILTP